MKVSRPARAADAAEVEVDISGQTVQLSMDENVENVENVEKCVPTIVASRESVD